MAGFPLFKSYQRKGEPATPHGTAQPAASDPARHGRKSGPTPTRKQAEAARRERLNPSITKKEARKRQGASNRSQRLDHMRAADNTPVRALLRDHIDAHRRLGEFLLPGLLLILGLTLAQNFWPPATLVSMILMYTYIVLVILDIVLMWRGYKKLHAQRLPDTPLRGLMLYGANRCIQMRRLRMPRPRVQRGESY